jgi:hypothetical protein
MQSLHRMIITLDHHQVTSDGECRWFVCDVSDKRRGDDPYYDPLWQAVEGKNDALLAAFMHELRTRDIASWNPEQVARKIGSVGLARKSLLRLAPPLVWLFEQVDAASQDPRVSSI